MKTTVMVDEVGRMVLPKLVRERSLPELDRELIDAFMLGGFVARPPRRAQRARQLKAEWPTNGVLL